MEVPWVDSALSPSMILPSPVLRVGAPLGDTCGRATADGRGLPEARVPRAYRKKCTTETLFWAKVHKGSPSECWLWFGAKIRKRRCPPRGAFHFRGKTWLAHRVAYTLSVGEIPAGLTLDHVRSRGCRSQLCVNPVHLEPVTNQENVRRARKENCRRGHAMTGRNAVVGSLRACRACHHLHNRAARLRKCGRHADAAAILEIP